MSGNVAPVSIKSRNSQNKEMTKMKRLWILIIALGLILSACAPAAPAPGTEQPAEQPSGEKVTIRALFMNQAGYQESDIEAITKEFEDDNPDVDVQTDYVSYEALHDKIVTAAASKAGTYDVVLIDCIWPAEFAAAGFILDVTDRISPAVQADIWPGAMEAVTYQGRLYAMPWLNDVLYLYYNEEMLKRSRIRPATQDLVRGRRDGHGREGEGPG
jgi:ABC-type glycerol-3-phosphate transport system substrate-binding protein